MMEKKMMITGEIVKKPEHIELGKYNVTVRTKGGKELTVQIDSEGIDERLEVILGKETAESYDTAVSGPSRKERGRSFFRWLAGLFRHN